MSTASSTSRPAGRGARKHARDFLRTWWLIAVIAILWEWGARVADAVYFVPLSGVLGQSRALWFSGPVDHLFLGPAVLEDVLPSIGRLLGGWLLGVVVGVLFGIAFGLVHWLYDYFNPVIEFLRAVPPVALVPVFLLLFGIGTQMQVLLIAFTAVFPMLLNTMDGVRSVDTGHIETARIFGITRRRFLRNIVLPSTLPRVFAGLEITSALALIVMAISEMTASTNGIGHRLVLDQQSFQFGSVWAGILFLGIIGYVLNRFVLAIERRALSWTPAERG